MRALFPFSPVRKLGSAGLPLLVILGASFSLGAGSGMASAQTMSSPPAVASGDTVAVVRASDDTRYRIGPGDVLSVVVRKAPELSGNVRVDQRGMIRLSMVEGEIRAACLTEGELAAEVTRLYREFKREPSVDVFVIDFQSRPVAVIGAVGSPGQYRMQRRVRLAELLTFAGGPNGSAGRVINVIHTGERNFCGEGSGAGETDAAKSFNVYKLFDTLAGKEEANPFVQPGDLVRIPEAEQIFVLGHVNQPGPIYLRDKTITISRALAMAGGPARDGKTSKIRIIRQVGDSDKKQEIFVDLKSIQKQKTEDIALMPNDVVEVGASTTKTLLNILQGTVPAAITQGAVRVIP